ncbi:tetratricopeptide and DUF676 domain protein [Fusarium subglutinans]|uniref:Tetratricopeptide and DUF676 domain protein n=1 Tax=Gibberella subglutinans TaxID=42677 RepID=A0A8H5UWB3_GIBSU|nr:tetratricopeptide and DUF676 domain protein [Fusarium subglutinans]KAF5601712.1 tetratricopeptide and DUF676 domain protein [Fusarium subglutinans]
MGERQVGIMVLSPEGDDDSNGGSSDINVEYVMSQKDTLDTGQTIANIYPNSILFVHGLDGDRVGSWTAEGPKMCFWPKDLLPRYFPKARIMTFGYNANVILNTVEGRIAEFANNLIAELSARRCGEVKSRPLIFVCHSMGGIVVKRALAAASNRLAHSGISESCHSIIFMATPHRGSSKAAYMDLATKLVNVLSGRVTTKAIKEITLFSDVLDDINSSFVDISWKYQIVSFFEKEPTGNLGMIVEKFSAVMEVPAEINQIACTANHRTICRFHDSGSADFTTFRLQLQSLVSSATDEAMSSLLDAMSSDSDRSFAISGLGGLGKTQLVLKFIHTYCQKLGYSHVLWATAEDSNKLANAFRDMAVELGVVEQSVIDDDRCRQAMRDWFTNHKRWLLILDNADKPRILVDYIPYPLHGSVILTSRDGGIQRKEYAASGLKLPPLTDADGASFLLKALRDHPDAPELDEGDVTIRNLAAEISRELGGHPLALTTIAAYINNCDSSLAEFLANFRQNRGEIFEKTAPYNLEPEPYYKQTLATCWSMTLRPLHLDKGAGAVLGILALLDPDKINMDILADYASDKRASRISALENPSTYRSGYIILRKRAFVYQGATGFTVHRLVQEAWISELNERHMLWEAFDDAVRCIARIYPRQVNGESMSNDFDDCRKLTSHVISLEKHFQKHFKQLFDSSTTSEHMPKSGERFAQLLADAGWFLYEAGQWESGKAFFETGISICDKVFAMKPTKLTAVLYNNLGVIYDSQHKPDESLANAMKALKIREECLPAGDPEMGNSYSNIGHSFIDKGDYVQAQKHYLDAIQVHEKCETPSHDLLEGAYSCMGKSMLYLDRLDEAEFWIQKAMHYHEHFKPANFFVAETLFAMGSLRMKQKRWGEAEELIQESLSIRTRILGKNARLVGVCLHHLGFIKDHIGELDMAETYFRRAIDIFSVSSEKQTGLLERSMIRLVQVLEHGAEANSEEVSHLREEISKSAKLDKLTQELEAYDDIGWEGVVQVAYRCYK